MEVEDDLEKVLKKAFLDADEALHTHLCYFNNGETHTEVIDLLSKNRPGSKSIEYVIQHAAY